MAPAAVRLVGGLLLIVALCAAGTAAGSQDAAKPAGAAPAQVAAASARPTATGPGYAASRPVFVALGDSITEFGHSSPTGWLNLMAQQYSRKADVINRGLSGWNTRWALEVLPHTLADLVPASQAGGAGGKPWSPRVQLLIIWFGANDAVTPSGADGQLAVPLEEYKANLAAMVKAARDAGVPHILLLTPPPVDEAKWAKARRLPSSDRLDSQVKKYAEAARAVGQQLGVPVLDVNSLVAALPADRRAAWTSDGVHPDAAGQAMVWDAVRDALENWGQFAQLRADSLPLHYPAYNQVDATNPKATFKELWDKKWVVPS